jgi:hypothetical protein
MKNQLSRRTVLRAAGASIALPMLDAMLPSGLRADTNGNESNGNDPNSAAPRRIVLLHRGLGTYHPYLVPKTAGLDYESNRYLKTLEAHRGKFTLFSGISHQGYPNSHETSRAIFTDAAPESLQGTIPNTVSLDQLIAEKIGGETRLRSLTMGSSNGAASLSWNRKGVPVPSSGGRKEVFARLFIDGSPEEIKTEMNRLAHGRSILDNLRGQLQSLKLDLGGADRDRLEVMETSIREAEVLLHQEEAWASQPKPAVDADVKEFSARDNSWIDGDNRWYALMRLALQTDSTRVIVYGISEHNNTNVQDLEIGHHDASHHGKDPAKIEQFARYEEKDYQNFAKFLDLLNETKEADGSLLDHTQVLLTSNLGDASAHASNNLPTILAGGGFKHQGHMAFDEANNLPLSNLYARMLQQFGIETDRFGRNKGVLTELV